MLQVTIVTTPDNPWEETGREVMNFVQRYTNYKCRVGKGIVGIDVEIEDVLLWSEASILINTFQTMLRNKGMEVAILSVKFA